MSGQNNINNSREEYNYDSNVSWMHRIQGLAALALAGMFGSIIPDSQVFGSMGAVIFSADGIGDLATGKHHYCFVKGYYFAKTQLKKLTK